MPVLKVSKNFLPCLIVDVSDERTGQLMQTTLYFADSGVVILGLVLALVLAQ